MDDEARHLREEFVTTLSNPLFKAVQDKLGVADGGPASLFWSGHRLIEAMAETIGVRAPKFVIDDTNAFSHPWPDLAPIDDLGPASLSALSRDYIAKVGEIVGADLSGGNLATEHVVMLQEYVRYEQSLAEQAAPSGPRA